MCSGSDNHTNAHLAPKTSPEPKVVGESIMVAEKKHRLSSEGRAFCMSFRYNGSRKETFSEVNKVRVG